MAASRLSAAYHMPKDGTEHHELGTNHLDRRSAEVKVIKLGYQVELQPMAKAA